MQGCEEHMELKGSTSDYTAKVTSQIPRKNVFVSAEVVRELSERLRILEEDGQVLKEAVEERRKLISAICTQFQAVHNSLQLRFQEREGKDLFLHPLVEGADLSQILSQLSNPSIVTRGLRIESCIPSQLKG
ncbi:PREDICTED: uncharacterized protein LOC109165593 [Ipomoea nil]|uniref:uncharacterized protein LOC109165593 n=1 Tax=Ipomoea nil TaxID=35883 RepID=UPI0009010AE5|nr:PREDICTED: uncharacterized protein LOC109165593 [Ipomoea nil]